MKYWISEEQLSEEWCGINNLIDTIRKQPIEEPTKELADAKAEIKQLKIKVADNTTARSFLDLISMKGDKLKPVAEKCNCLVCKELLKAEKHKRIVELPQEQMVCSGCGKPQSNNYDWNKNEHLTGSDDGVSLQLCGYAIPESEYFQKGEKK